MPIIDRLEASKHVKGRILVFFRDAELIKLTEDDLLLHQLYAGKELSPVAYTALLEASRLSSAKRTAARICSARLLSRGELIQKLREKGEDTAYSEQVADWLEELGVLNDAHYTSVLVRHYTERGYGRRRMEAELLRRKVSRVYWFDAFAEFEERDETQNERIDRLVAQRLKNVTQLDDKALGKVQAFLLRRGFSWEQAHEALERYRSEYLSF